MTKTVRRWALFLAGILGISLVSCTKEDTVTRLRDSSARSAETSEEEHLSPDSPEPAASVIADEAGDSEVHQDLSLVQDTEVIRDTEELSEPVQVLKLSSADELELENGVLYILSFDDDGAGDSDAPQPREEIQGETLAILPKERKSLAPAVPEEKVEPPRTEPEPQSEPEPVVIPVVEPEPEPVIVEPGISTPEPVIIPAAEPEEPVVETEEPAIVIAEPAPVPEEIPEAEPVTEPPVAETLITEGPRILLTSPRNGAYYRSSLLLDGRCLPLEEMENVKEGRVKSLNWRIPSQGEWSNPVFMEEDGSFQLDLMTAGLEGPQQLILESEDFGGRVSRQIVSLRDGNQAPEIVLESGNGERSYGAHLTLKGFLKDPYKTIPGLEGFRELRYRLVPRDRNSGEKSMEGNIPLERDGSFFMAIGMEDRTGEQMLVLEAEGKNESIRSLEIFLVPGRGDIPSFTMVPQDGRLVFNWEEHPDMVGQTLYLTDHPSLEPEKDPQLNFRGVKPPLVIDRTVNGRLYRARLEILTEEGKYLSELLEAVPLAPGTLDLRARGGFEQVRLDWEDISGAKSFRIWRKSGNDDFALLADDLEGNSYIDATATFGTTYHYRIEPADVAGPLSYAVPAASTETPSDKMTLASHYRQIIPEKIAVKGDYAFVAAGQGGFHIMDISIPQKPESIGFLDQEGVHDVYLGSEYVYLASGDKGFQVVNIEEPKRPFTVLSRVTPDARCIAGREEQIFVGDSQLGLQIFDIRDRANPQRLSTLREYSPQQIVLDRNLLYAALGENGLVILDITNPYNPKEVGAFRASPVYDVLIEDELMYLACGAEGMAILAADASGLWREISRFEGSDTRMIRMWENYAMIADGTGGMKAVDVSNPLSPQYYGLFSSSEIRALAMADDYALLADVSGLKVVRTYLYGQSFIRQRWETPGRAYGVLSSGRQLWVADRTGGVAVYQADSPAGMSEASLLRTFPAEFAEDILIRDSMLYVSDGPAGVKGFRLDKADNSPVLEVSVSGRVRRVLPYGSRFAVVSSGEGILLFKENRTGGSLNWEISSRYYTSDPRDAVFHGPLLIVGDARDGLIMAREFDGQFREMQRFPEFGGIRQVTLKDNVLYVLYKEGIALFDMTNPDHPVQTAFIPAVEAEGLQVAGEYLYLAEGFRGVSVYRLNGGGQPVKVSVCSELFAVDAAPAGDILFVADMDGIAVIKVIIPNWK